MATANSDFSSEQSKHARSLAATLATAFTLLTVFALVLGSSFLLVLNFQAQETVVAREQELIATNAAHEVSSFINAIFQALESAVQVSDPITKDNTQQKLFLRNLLGLQPTFLAVTLLDKQGQEIAKQSQYAVVPQVELKSQADSELFRIVSEDRRYISPIFIDEQTKQPLAWVAIPVVNIFGNFQGALVVQVNLKFMWELVAQLQIGQQGDHGVAYIVDHQGNLLAFQDTARVLAGENVSQLKEVAQFIHDDSSHKNGYDWSVGIGNNYVVGAFVPLGVPDWAVVTELPITEAYQGVISTIILSLSFLFIVGGVSAMGGIYTSRRLAYPLLNLTTTATRISEGELNLTASLAGPIEVVGLARAFNIMTAQLRDLIGSLEQRVAARTERLETVASLSERLSAILDLDQLLQNLVTQIKTSFNYYHVHVYLLDEPRQNLIMTAGFGVAGSKMKAKGHYIPLNTVTSLVARAARSGEIVRVDDVRQAIDWLPNPLLALTCSEMAVPISLEGQVVGVLDVQEDKVAGFDESDAALLRSLANQVAIAIRNARLFAEVEAALVESNAIQARYLEQSWEKVIATLKHKSHAYAAPHALTLPEQVVEQGHELAQHYSKPQVKHFEETAHPTHSLISPITVMGRKIGDLQLHRVGLEYQEMGWNKDEVAIITAVIDQIAQAAENLRLFEETRERAGREQVIREITDKLRLAPNLDTLLDIAARELGQRLGVRHTVLELGVDLQKIRANTAVFELKK